MTRFQKSRLPHAIRETAKTAKELALELGAGLRDVQDELRNLNRTGLATCFDGKYLATARAFASAAPRPRTTQVELGLDDPFGGAA